MQRCKSPWRCNSLRKKIIIVSIASCKLHGALWLVSSFTERSKIHAGSQDRRVIPQSITTIHRRATFPLAAIFSGGGVEVANGRQLSAIQRALSAINSFSCNPYSSPQRKCNAVSLNEITFSGFLREFCKNFVQISGFFQFFFRD